MLRIAWIVSLAAALARAALADDAPPAAAPPGADEGLKAACASLLRAENQAAREALDLALSSAPRHTDAYLHRALARARLGDAAGAAADYREALKQPKDAEPRAPQLRLCDPALAAEEAKLAGRRRAAEAARKRGVELFLKGESTAALAAFDAALLDDPGDPESHASRAVARAAAQDAAGAAADYEAAFRSASAAGRWELAADAALGWAGLPDAAGAAAPGAIAALTELPKMAGPGWARRAELEKELGRRAGAGAPAELEEK